MAAAGYTTDLTTVNILDSDATPSTVGEPTGSTAGTTIAIETDHYVVSTASISKIFNATGVGGLGFQNGTAVTVPADGAVYMWTNFLAPNAISVQSTGGMQILVGNTLANYKRFYVYGDDTVPYGGWQVNAVNPANTASATQGTPNGTWQYFGMAANVEAAVARGYPLAWDAVRAGRGSIEIINGDLANGYATFAGAATVNDSNTVGAYNRWGIFSYSNGTYTLQGRLSLGTAATAVDFRDSNRAIFIKNTEFVTAAFNQIEILNAASRVDWTGISISSLGTLSKGRVIVSANATVNINNCSFTDMDSFTFLSNSTINDTVFRRCGLVTQGAAPIDQCIFDNPSGTTGLAVSSPANLGLVTNTTFNSDGTGYAITLTGTAADCTLSGNFFNGYAATNGTTGNEAIFVNIATGTMTINITNGGNTPSIRTAGATVTVANSKTFTVTNVRENSEVRIYRASDLVEFGGVENVSASPTGVSNVTVSADPDNAGRFRVAYSYAYTADTPIFVVALHNNYQALRPAFTLKSTDTSLQLTQIADRQYLNP